MLGVSLVVLLFCLLVYLAFAIGRAAEKKGTLFAAFFAYGLGLLFAGQALINIGVNTGLLPTKGLTLPFVSYGGSSLLVSCAMVGMMLRFAHDLNQPESTSRRSANVRR